MARSRKERKELERQETLRREEEQAHLEERIPVEPISPKRQQAKRIPNYYQDPVQEDSPKYEEAQVKKAKKKHKRPVRQEPVYHQGSAYQEPVYQEPIYQPAPVQGRRRGCGCGCGCWTWIIIILLIIVLLIAAKAFFDVQTSVGVMNQDSGYSQMRDQDVSLLRAQDTLTFLLMGIDSSDSGSVESGRSDTMVFMTANPRTNMANMLSIPRDSYVEIPGHGQDKINHAYSFGGPDLAVETVQNFLQVPVDYYVAIDMEGLQQVIDALGGIEVVPTFTFDQDGYHFDAGVSQHVDGAGALAYTRNRKSDPVGDYGRQERQRQVISVTMDKVTSLDGIMRYPRVLLALENSLVTNANLLDMIQGFTGYRSTLNNVQQHQLMGQGQMINGIYYEIIPEDQVLQARSLLQAEVYSG